MEKTINSILNGIREKIKSDAPISPLEWIDNAAELNVLVEDLDNALLDARQKVAHLKCELLEGGESVAAAEVRVEATDEFKEYLRLRAKREMVIEYVRICKVRAKLDTWNV